MRRILPLALPFALVACLIAFQAFSQSPSSSLPATAAPPANASPQTVHYHYHYHYHAATPAPLYQPYYVDAYGGRAPAGSYGQPSPASSPTPANPYPAGYVPGPFTPMGFLNTNPNAPTAQGVIHVFLPTKDAVVCLNGQKMRGAGKDRKFTTPVLASNQEYQYWVTATFPENGESVTQYRKVYVGAGEYTVADFTRPPEPASYRAPAGPVNQNEAFPAQPQ